MTCKDVRTQPQRFENKDEYPRGGQPSTVSPAAGKLNMRGGCGEWGIRLALPRAIRASQSLSLHTGTE
jgi:hypothetical protein